MPKGFVTPTKVVTSADVKGCAMTVEEIEESVHPIEERLHAVHNRLVCEFGDQELTASAVGRVEARARVLGADAEIRGFDICLSGDGSVAYTVSLGSWRPLQFGLAFSPIPPRSNKLGWSPDGCRGQAGMTLRASRR